MRNSNGRGNSGRSGCRTLEIIRTVEEIEHIRPVWQELQRREPVPAVNADIDRYLSVLAASSAKKVEPMILLLRENENPRTMIVGRLESYGIPLRIGYKTLLKPKLRAYVVIYGGILGQPDEDLSGYWIYTLRDLQKKGIMDVVLFNRLRTISPFYQEISKKKPILLQNHFPEMESHWRMHIPSSIDDFYAERSKKHRKHLRQYDNKLQRRYGGQIQYITYSQPDEVDRAVRDAAEVSQKTYQHSLGAGFPDTPEKRSILKSAARLGWFRGHLLYVDNRPVAYRFALQYRGVYFGDGIGYDPDWRKYRIGTLLFLRVLERLCKEKEVHHYDFGFGNAEYKESYGDEVWQEVAMKCFFASRLYPFFICIITSLNAAIVTAIVRCFERFKILSRIKRRWRDRLSEKYTPPER